MVTVPPDTIAMLSKFNSAPEVPMVKSVVFSVSEEINLPTAAFPDPEAVADQVPLLDTTPVDGEPKAGDGSVIVASNEDPPEVLISRVPPL
jgi:hypothetical protein